MGGINGYAVAKQAPKPIPRFPMRYPNKPVIPDQNFCVILWRGLNRHPQGSFATATGVAALFNIALPATGAAVAFGGLSHLHPPLFAAVQPTGWL